jgi:anti-repressor protein
MNELVFKTEKGTSVTTSLLVAEKFSKDHKNVLRDIRNLMEKSSAQNWAQYYQLSTYKDSSGKTNEMFLMNRDGFSLLVMGFTGEQALQFKIDFIEAFNKMETAIQSIPDFNSPAIAARAWADQFEKRQLAENQIKELGPKIEVFEKVMSSDCCIDLGQAARVLNINVGRNRLFELLRDGKILTPLNIPYQTYIDRKYFKCIETPYTKGEKTYVHIKTLVTQKGIEWLSQTLTQRAES